MSERPSVTPITTTPANVSCRTRRPSSSPAQPLRPRRGAASPSRGRNAPVDKDFTDPLESYRYGYADGFLIGVSSRHAGTLPNRTSSDYPDSIGYQRGFRDGGEDGYADVTKESESNPTPDYGQGYFDGFFDGVGGKDSACRTG
jgi:hypothetical protein